jgi:hypothetical protein
VAISSGERYTVTGLSLLLTLLSFSLNLLRFVARQI